MNESKGIVLAKLLCMCINNYSYASLCSYIFKGIRHTAKQRIIKNRCISVFFFCFVLYFCIDVVCICPTRTLFFFCLLSLAVHPLFFFISFLQRLHSHTLRAAFLQFLVALLPFTCYFICWFNRVLKLPSCDCCCRLLLASLPALALAAASPSFASSFVQWPMAKKRGKRMRVGKRIYKA